MSVDVENKSIFLNKTVALTCIYYYFTCVSYMCIDIFIRKNTLYDFENLTYIKKGNIYQKERETSMPIVTNNEYCSWKKSAVNMKLSSDTSVMRITYEVLTKFQSFMDFNSNIIESLSKACTMNIDRIIADVPNGIAAKNAVRRTNIITISIRPLVVATNTVRYYTSIGQTPNFDNTYYVNVFGEFKTDYNAYILLKKKTSP